MHYLAPAQLSRLLAISRKHDMRVYVAILLGYSHGLRISEIIDLKVSDFADGYLTVQRLKGSYKTVQPLTLNELDDVLPWLQKFGRYERIIQLRQSALGFYFERFARLAGIPEHLRHFHVLKHTCGRAVISSGIEYARQYLGHKSISSTGAYCRVSDAEAAEKCQARL